MDVLGVRAADALHLLRSGTFDVMSVQIDMASGDDPFFEGLAVVGVATDAVRPRKVEDACRDVFDKRLQEKIGAKVLMLWPFGPQNFYCNTAIKTLDDLNGLKMRSFMPSMAALIWSPGTVSGTLPFSEAYPALKRGVANCGVTSPRPEIPKNGRKPPHMSCRSRFQVRSRAIS
jgi:TRAP-type C4-dicarboxylate transport system substrate-binding protein